MDWWILNDENHLADARDSTCTGEFLYGFIMQEASDWICGGGQSIAMSHLQRTR
jgi:hypothetical protein